MAGAISIGLGSFVALGLVLPISGATEVPATQGPALLSSSWLTTTVGGHVLSSYDAATGPTTGGPAIVQGCIMIGGQCTHANIVSPEPFTIGTTYQNGPGIGVYLQGPPTLLQGQAVPSWSCGGSSATDVSSFTVDQLQFDFGGALTAAAFRFSCQHQGSLYTGALSYGTKHAGQGYYLYGSDGTLSGFGNDHYLNYLGDPSAIPYSKPVVGMQITPDGGGYWMGASDGGVFAYGDAGFFGSAGDLTLNAPIVGMAATPDGGGYWLVASDGGVFSYGDAAYQGSMGATHLNRPVVGIAPSPSGGYWLVASDGGIFSFGPAPFFGSMGGLPINRPVVGMTPTTTGHGYWMVASDGGVFAFGLATFHGSTAALTLQAPITAMAVTSTDSGYWLAAADGGVFALDAPFFGSLGGQGVLDLAGIAT